MIKVYDTVKKQYYPFEDYLESLTNDDLYGRVRSLNMHAPYILSATVKNAQADTIVITFSETLDESEPGVDVITIAGKTVNEIDVVGAVVTVVVTVAFISTDVISAVYTVPELAPLKSAITGIEVDAFTQSITNNVNPI